MSDPVPPAQSVAPPAVAPAVVAAPHATATAPSRPPAPEHSPWARIEQWRPAGPPPAGHAGVPRRASADLDGVGRVELRAVAYAPAPAERTVTLSIDGGGEVTLHQGDTVRGVEVQLILAEIVYVRHRGTVVALGASR